MNEKKFEELYKARKEKILNSKSREVTKKTIYYVSSNGDDNNDGKSPEKAWKTLQKVSLASTIESGDAVLFRRGDIFRGSVLTHSGVFYGAYGEGSKPCFFSGDRDYADEKLWICVNKSRNIWKCTSKMLDVGTLVFNHGEKHSRKLIPSYIGGRFVCRDNENKPFDYNEEMTEDLDIYWHYDTTFDISVSRGENFPVPEVRNTYGELYLRCDNGNPGKYFNSIEAAVRKHMFTVGDNSDVSIDNLCIKYVGMIAVSGEENVSGLTVTNCEIGWIGGTIQHYLGTDPNYPQGGRGTVTRFGNAIEIYGGCENYTVSDCYIYECYDAGVTHQRTTDCKIAMKKIRYTNNLIEKCVYGIEYFLDQINGETESTMDDVLIDNNFIRLSGYGWGQQRHNKETPALIKGWSYVNTARNFSITNNIFDRCAYRMLHLVALKDEFCPNMDGNVYIQNYGGQLGQYGGNESGEPEMIIYDDRIEEKITNIFKDKNHEVYYFPEL